LKQKRSLLRGNIEKLSKPSVRVNTLRAQKDELKKAETALVRKEQRVFRLQVKVRDLRAQLNETKLRHKNKNTAQSKRACETAANKLKTAIQHRKEAVSQYRDMKQVVRDQRATYRKLERKEAAKQKAVAQFLKKWEREYDREISLREKKAKQRRRWLESD
jgi:ABC-type transporter Mla subunit MlaD